MVPTQRSRYILIWRSKTRPIPSFFLVNDFQLLDDEEDQQDRRCPQDRAVARFPSLTQQHYAHEEDGDEGDRNGDDPSLESILLSVAPRENDGLTGLRVTASEWHIVDNVIDDARTAGNVDELSYNSGTSDPVNQKAQWFQMNFMRV